MTSKIAFVCSLLLLGGCIAEPTKVRRRIRISVATGNWTLVETLPISVTGGYLEFGFHTRLTSGNSANYIHMDDVELIKL